MSSLPVIPKHNNRMSDHRDQSTDHEQGTRHEPVVYLQAVSVRNTRRDIENSLIGPADKLSLCVPQKAGLYPRDCYRFT